MNKENSTGITVEQANELREECKEAINLADCLTRLQNNADFKKLINENYLELEPIRLVHLLADPSLNNCDNKAKNRESIQECMLGIARLSEYFRSILLMADQAHKSLDALNEAEQDFYNSTSNKEQ